MVVGEEGQLEGWCMKKRKRLYKALVVVAVEAAAVGVHVLLLAAAAAGDVGSLPSSLIRVDNTFEVMTRARFVVVDQRL